MNKNLNELAKEIHKINKSKGFWDEKRNIGEMLMLIVSELGEALEADRKDKHTNKNSHSLDCYIIDGDKAFKQHFEQNIKDTFEDEIADAVIRLLDLSVGLNIDIEWHIEQKMKYNETRNRFHDKKY